MKDFKSIYDCTMEERSIILAEYLIEHNSTVRGVASEFGISKSTVHKDMTQTLKRADNNLYAGVKRILEKNKRERHLRGGEATRRKYISLK